MFENVETKLYDGDFNILLECSLQTQIYVNLHVSLVIYKKKFTRVASYDLFKTDTAINIYGFLFDHGNSTFFYFLFPFISSQYCHLFLEPIV